jgi:hypothetical protein
LWASDAGVSQEHLNPARWVTYLVRAASVFNPYTVEVVKLIELASS